MKITTTRAFLLATILGITGCVGPIGYVQSLLKDHKNAQLQTKELAASKAEVIAANNAISSAKTTISDQSATITTLQSRDSTIQWDAYGTLSSLKTKNYPLALTFGTYTYNGFGTPLSPDQARQVEAIVTSVEDQANAKIADIQASADKEIAEKNAQISTENTTIQTEVAATKDANAKFVAAATQAATTGVKLDAVTKQNTQVVKENAGLTTQLSSAVKATRNILILIAFIWALMAWIIPGINALCKTVPALAFLLVVTAPLSELCHLALSGLHYILLKVEALFQKKLVVAATTPKPTT
jgi:hypothetical protein